MSHIYHFAIILKLIRKYNKRKQPSIIALKHFHSISKINNNNNNNQNKNRLGLEDIRTLSLFGLNLQNISLI